MSGKTLGVLAVVILIIVGVWFAMSSSPSAPSQATNPPPTTITETPPPPTDVSPTGTTLAKTVITMTDSGFSPKDVSIAEGQTVTWVNNSSIPMWVASDVHPTHVVYDHNDKNTHCATSYTGPAPFDECKGEAAGSSYTFTFTKVGTWPFHNHASAQMTGTVTVKSAAPGAPTGTL